MFENKTIGKKISLIVFLSGVGVLLLSSVAYVGMEYLSFQTEQLYKHPYTVSNCVRDIKYGIVAIHRNMKDVALAKDMESINVAAKAVDEEEAKVFKAFDKAEERFLGDKKDVLQ